MRRGPALPILIVLAAVLAAAWLASPVLAARALIAAGERGDAAALARLVDFPAFRDSLKAQLTTRLVDEMRARRGDDNALSGLGLMLAPSLVSGAVDALVTPEAIGAMVRTGQAPAASPRTPGDPAPATDAGSADEDEVRQSWAYRDPNAFAVTLSRAGRPDERLALILERRGLFGWKLAGVELPAARA